MALAYLGCFGLFVWLGYLVQKSIRWAKLLRNRRRVAAAAKAEQTADALRAIQNLEHISGPEAETIWWMYHMNKPRVRASGALFEFQNLVNLKILRVEDYEQPYQDRFFLLPDYVQEVLQKRLGARNEKTVEKEPPWVSRPRW